MFSSFSKRHSDLTISQTCLIINSTKTINENTGKNTCIKENLYQFFLTIKFQPRLKRTFWSVFLLKTLGQVFQIPGRMFFHRPVFSKIRSVVYLDNDFVIQYQNNRSDFSDNLVINLHYHACKLSNKTIRPGNCNTFRIKNQIIWLKLTGWIVKNIRPGCLFINLITCLQSTVLS